ncbi:LysR family transcriptional regulator [Nonomuraea sediminis]|uniref:LysR family transcriptional regulator n=1 Tax=Nonomuraea sediminis TaxID=2835864 RepID=UPI001BDC045C|nr:LysR family transcriptional regulator [Nonomuraea sediminis]
MHQTQPSLDLLTALDVLLEEGSVSGAAARLHLSEPAMSRTLGRIRKAMGDPILVRSGRRMVPTPRALAVQGEVRALVEAARRVFVSPAEPDPATLVREFVIMASDPVTAAIGAPLLAEVARQAPGVTLRFVPEGPGELRPLREGVADLQVTVLDEPDPGSHVESLITDQPVAVVRPGHPLLDGEVTPARFAAADHVVTSRRGRTCGPIDHALAALGLRRRVVGSMPTFTAAMFVVLASDLVGMAGGDWLMCGAIETLGLVSFPIPLDLPPIRISQAWHARYDADPAHAWLRAQVRDAFHAPGTARRR